jgi:tyrosyl-DNA phosphodiesterase 2
MVEPLPSTVRILTWNIDFMASSPEERLTTAFAHIQNDVFRCEKGEAPEPCCILLQEIHEQAFHVILENEWIRKHFILTPLSPEKWPSSATYGNVTLVSRLIPVSYAWSLEFGCSKMSRNVLLVDIKLSVPTKSQVITLRVGNTHLESMPEGAKARPEQMGLIAKVLKDESLDGGIACGDMNAIGPSDWPLAEKVGLVDAWKGDDEDEEGFTWGYQSPSEHPPGRLDKILFIPGTAYEVDEPKIVGAGLKTTQGLWASDHFGLVTTLRLCG